LVTFSFGEVSIIETLRNEVNTLEDNAIMLKVAAGDLDKMSLLFERHSRKLFAFLFHQSHKREASEDMVQNVFYRMLKYRHTFTAESNFTGWMYHIARNVIKDQVKKYDFATRYDPIDEHEEHIAGGTLADEQIEKKQARAGLYDAMRRLSDNNRELLTLSRFQHLKYSEIGEMMGISEGAVKVRIYRAMQELKNIYTEIER
jgi:RNA polymerase sigma factor (sigma-70 family)